ncbi:hypothetical protein [Puia sp.]|uniref:hypothetical protein n=1 Tax=Puia sp. TaxID=2045100 RepID=UPI002F413C21
MTDRQLIELGAQELAARHGFADWKEMRQRDLEYLCQRIEESSGILISLSTIKRIVNGQYNRLPQVATLNALSVYLGYADWQAFKGAKQQAAATTAPPGAEPAALLGAEPAPRSVEPVALLGVEPSAPSQASTPVTRPPIAPSPDILRRRPSYPLIGAGVLFFVLLALLSWNYFSSNADHPSKASFGIRRTTVNAVPNTVIFTYDIDHVPGDSFFIQQSWDKHRRVRIGKGSHTLTDIYYEPGYHTAKLIANEKIIATLGVSIPTDDWFFYSKESLSQGLPSYIRTANPIRNGILGLEKQDLVANHIDPEKPQIFLCSYFPTNIGTNADNFRLNARIRMTELRNTPCPMIMPEVFCQHGLMYFVCTMPGCSGEGGDINAQFGEHFVNGKTNDLSPLSFDVHAWHNIEMIVDRKRVRISIDGKMVLTQSYNVSAGLITGLGFHSNGLCAVDSIRLTGLDGKTVYPAQ